MTLEVPPLDNEQIHTYNIVVLKYRCIECDNKYCDHEAYRVTWIGSNPYEAKRQYVESTWDCVFMGDKNKFVTPLEWKCPAHPDAAVLKCHYICQYDEELSDTCLEEDSKFSFRWSDVF